MGDGEHQGQASLPPLLCSALPSCILPHPLLRGRLRADCPTCPPVPTQGDTRKAWQPLGPPGCPAQVISEQPVHPSLERVTDGCLLRPLFLPLPWTPLWGSPLAQAGSWVPQFCLCPCLPLPDLEQRILEVLRDAGSPVKTAQLLKKCQVPKKKLNQVLHKMKEQSKGVMLAGPATWCLGDNRTKEVAPAERGNLSPGVGEVGVWDPA